MGIKESQVPEEMDTYELAIEKMRESRVALIEKLEKAVQEGDITASESIEVFCRATQWDIQKAARYMQAFTQPQSSLNLKLGAYYVA